MNLLVEQYACVAWYMMIFSAFFIGKKTLILAMSATHRTKIFSIAPSIHMLETIQIWFISDNELGGMKCKKTLKTRLKKAPHENYLVILFLLVKYPKLQLTFLIIYMYIH